MVSCSSEEETSAQRGDPTSTSRLPLFADLTAALAAGVLTYLVARWYAHSSATPAEPSVEVARAAGEAVRPHARLRRIVVRRLDRTVATGFLLTLALSITLLCGLALGVLAFLVRRVAFIQHFDNVVAAWGYAHRSATSTKGLDAITELGRLEIVVVLALALAVFEVIRWRERWSFLFLLTVLVGMEAIMLGVKDLVGRVRPTLDPAAASLGPSFPSGHSSTSAAFYAAAALVVGRHLPRRARQIVVAAAVAVAVAVAASRVLLDLHWLSDVIGGLSLGWAWFALCGVVFGGRLLTPTAGVEVAAAEAAAPLRPIRSQNLADTRGAGKQPAASDRRHARHWLPTGRNRHRRSGSDPPALPG
jgi:membrane-associated phospholipid phosphatase